MAVPCWDEQSALGALKASEHLLGASGPRVTESGALGPPPPSPLTPQTPRPQIHCRGTASLTPRKVPQTDDLHLFSLICNIRGGKRDLGVPGASGPGSPLLGQVDPSCWPRRFSPLSAPEPVPTGALGPHTVHWTWGLASPGALDPSSPSSVSPVSSKPATQGSFLNLKKQHLPCYKSSPSYVAERQDSQETFKQPPRGVFFLHLCPAVSS
ncbi:Hypothetical predicted protein [Marmota monax]|uniref:Uncharacterized protein n=1 Tax=Marmota monax TaxID=9995 RepID=A0A5E4A3F3_MARMO|nr:Hypothetical predicted protein [Marmota monax]